MNGVISGKYSRAKGAGSGAKVEKRASRGESRCERWASQPGKHFWLEISISHVVAGRLAIKMSGCPVELSLRGVSGQDS